MADVMLRNQGQKLAGGEPGPAQKWRCRKTKEKISHPSPPAFEMYLCSLADQYDNPIPPRFLAPIDSLKIPDLDFFSSQKNRSGSGVWNSGHFHGELVHTREISGP